MAGRAGPGPTILASGKLPTPNPNFASTESNIVKAERHAKQEAIALGYETHGNQTRAVREAQVAYPCFNDWLHSDSSFQERMLQAHHVWKEKLQASLYRMVETQEAQEHPNPVPVIFALKGNWPDKYGDKQHLQISEVKEFSIKIDASPAILALLTLRQAQDDKARQALAEGEKPDEIVEGQVQVLPEGHRENEE